MILYETRRTYNNNLKDKIVLYDKKMGATGSSCFDRWVTLSDNAIHEKCNTLERKISSIETNNNTLHTKYATLEAKHEALCKKMNNTLSEMDLIVTRLDRVEKKASNMLFEQHELHDMDEIVIINP
jgi:thermostable 8-oxoguanine DNA glycosylase